MMLTDFRGIPRTLSEDVYVLSTDVTASYSKGTQVRLIAGIDGSRIPGYHFTQGYVTVCRVDAVQAEFIGVKRRDLKRR